MLVKVRPLKTEQSCQIGPKSVKWATFGIWCCAEIWLWCFVCYILDDF